MERADRPDVKHGSLFQKCLNLRAVFSDDPEVVAARLARPILVGVESAELAERIRGKEHAVEAVVCDDYLGPVNHGRGHKIKRVPAEREGIAVPDLHLTFGKIRSEELPHHRKCLGVRNDNGIGIYLHEIHDVCRMIGLHVLNYKIIGLLSVESLFEIVEPFVCEVRVNGVHDRDLVIRDEIRVVSHAVFNAVLPLEQIDLSVVYSDVGDVVGNLHL